MSKVSMETFKDAKSTDFPSSLTDSLGPCYFIEPKYSQLSAKEF